MKYLIVSYSARTSVFAFSKYLQTRGVACEIINTPKSIASSCGLSIKLDFKFFNFVIENIKKINLSGFVGVFLYNSSSFYGEYQRLL